MNSLKNSVRLTGFLGNNPEVKNINEKTKLAKVSLATNEYYKNSEGERVEDTQWHNLILWNNKAKYAESNLAKGSEVSIEGKLASRSYIDKNGEKRFVTEIIVNEVLLLNRKQA